MGWIVATCVLGATALVLLGLLAFAAHLIAKMYSWRVTFEDELSDRIDMSIRMLDQSHMEIVTVANTPVFFDSPEVRRVVSAVKKARAAVINVTELLTDVEVDENDERAELTMPTGPYDERMPVPTKTSQVEDALKNGAVLNFPDRDNVRRSATRVSSDEQQNAVAAARREASYMSTGARKAAIAAANAARNLKKTMGGS